MADMKFLIDIVIFAVIFVICIPVGYIVAGFFEDLFTPKDVKEARRKADEEFGRERERKERFPHEYEDKRKERFAKYNPCELYFPTVQDWEAQKEYIDDYDEYIQKWAFEYYKIYNIMH
ncbi:MAG: hypothetical protein MJZ36_00995 [Bacteroidaceae bacterium]|nr:hypothetical protein [Bacteroidaceae bacterium]